MKKLLALVLCLVLCVSMFAACGDGEPVDTTKSATPDTTKAPNNETTKPTDETTNPTDETTTPGDETTQGTESSDSTTGTDPDGPVAPEDDLYDVKDPDEDKLAIENIGAVNAGSVATDYITFATTGISSLSEITDLNGSYYLKGDISANDTTVLGKFKGVLDGCGHTITTTVAIFENFGGIVRNLNIAGDISYTVDPQAPLALELTNGAAIVNVKSTVKLTVGESEEKAVYAAGFALTGAGSVLFYNCEFAGTIVNDLSGVNGNDRRVGGFVAKFGGLFSESENSEDPGEQSKLLINSCTFNGSVKGSSHIGGFFGELAPSTDAEFYSVAVKGTVRGTFEGSAGGIMGYTGGTASSMVDFYNCYNEAAVSIDETVGQKANAGGLAGYLNNSGGASMVSFTYCTNKGDVSATQHIGGMVGKCNNYVTFEECANYGDLTAYEITPDIPSKTDNFVGGLVGFTNGSKVQNTIEKCVNFGDITGNTQRVRMGGLVGHNESGSSGFEIVDSMNFGNITSNYKSQAVNDADYRLGGIVSGGYGHYIIKNCVNFGDVTGYFHKTVQPVGGILGMGHNQAGLGDVLENCVNYGNVSSLADPIDGVYGGTQCAGLVGCLYGGGEFSIKGCVNAGIINGFGVSAAFAYQYNANLSPDAVFDNNFYLENCYPTTRIDGTNYGVFGIDATNLIHEETSAKATAFAKAQIADTTSEGLAAKLNAALGSDVYVVTEVTLANGLPFKCAMPKVLVSE